MFTVCSLYLGLTGSNYCPPEKMLMSWGLRTTVLKEGGHFVIHVPTLGCHSEAKRFGGITKQQEKHSSSPSCLCIV